MGGWGGEEGYLQVYGGFCCHRQALAVLHLYTLLLMGACMILTGVFCKFR